MTTADLTVTINDCAVIGTTQIGPPGGAGTVAQQRWTP
jgi:hypothetical protein